MLPVLTQNMRLPYFRRVLSIAGDALIGYWPMNEPSGAVAFDQSNTRSHGAYTGVDLNYPGIGDGWSAPFFDGTNDYCNIYSAALNTAFNNAEGTLAAWVRVAASGVWTDATLRRGVFLSADANNRVLINRASANNTVTLTYAALATTKTITIGSLTTTDWQQFAITWSASADQVKGYMNGTQRGATLTTIGVWVGALSSTGTLIGAGSTVPANVWSGTLAHVALYNRALSANEIAELYRLN